MNTNEEIMQMEQAIRTINKFFSDNYNQIDPKAFSKWGYVRSSIIEELYYAKKLIEEEEKRV